MKIFVGMTGASGSIYGIRLLQSLKENNVDVYLTVTEAGHQVCRYETGINPADFAKEHAIKYYPIDDLFAPPSSGSYRLDALVILPCSMGTLSRIAVGNSNNLLERASDVALKEGYKLIISPRETPLNRIHLENMLRLTQAGAHIMPITVALYNKPQTLDDIINFHVGKILDFLGIDHSLFRRWGSV